MQCGISLHPEERASGQGRAEKEGGGPPPPQRRAKRGEGGLAKLLAKTTVLVVPCKKRLA